MVIKMDNPDLIRIKKEIRKKQMQNQKSNKRNGKLFKYVSKTLVLVCITLITLIVLKSNPKLQKTFYQYVFENNITFAKINKWYESKFGSAIPFSNWIKDNTETVFNEKLQYKEINKYEEGVKLTVDNNYLIPVLESGIVVFIGDKDNYQNTIIIQQVNGIDVWYSNVNNSNLKLYDYVEKGGLVGETINNELLLVFKKDGKVIDYQEYIK